MDTGFRTGQTDEVIRFQFGTPVRSAMIWGMQFMKEQLVRLGTNIDIKIKYYYYKDAQHGVYSDFRNPTEVANTYHTVSGVNANSLDDNGLLYFTHPSDPNKPLKFVAATVEFILNAGYINFDLLGMLYDFDTASDGKHADNADDMFNEKVIATYWMKGKITYLRHIFSISLKNSCNFKFLIRGWHRDNIQHPVT